MNLASVFVATPWQINVCSTTTSASSLFNLTAHKLSVSYGISTVCGIVLGMFIVFELQPTNGEHIVI